MTDLDSIDVLAAGRAFARIGARFRAERFPAPRLRRNRPLWWRRRLPRPRPPYTFDVDSDRRGERFLLRWNGAAAVELQPLHVDPARRHLLLLVREGAAQHRFLCGHDERHWFAAAVPGSGVTTVAAALEALKPAAVRELQDRLGVVGAERQRRRNPGYVRQGEWFFVPAPEAEGLVAAGEPVLRHEPLTRGGKPHVMEECLRSGGVRVYACRRFPTGLAEDAYRDLLRRDPRAAGERWRVFLRDPTVYCRGRVRHRDHATVELAGWHRVYANTEAAAPGREALVFLD